MEFITRNKFLVIAILVLAGLYWARISHSPRTDTKAVAESETTSESNDQKTSENKIAAATSQQSQTPKSATAQTQMPNQTTADALNPDMQKFAYECFNGWYFSQPKEDVKSMSKMLKGFFKENKISKLVAEKEVNFIDSDGSNRKLRAVPVGFDDDGKPKMLIKLFSANGKEEPLTYELQNLEWSDVATRMLGDKQRTRERTVLEVSSEDRARLALVEYVNGERSSVHFEIAGRKLTCGKDAAGNDVHCDCQKEF